MSILETITSPARNAWRRRIVIRASSALLIACAGTVHAQAPTPTAAQTGALTLGEAIRRAQESSPLLRASREAVASAQGNARQASAFANPVFSYGREQTAGAGLSNAQDIAQFEQPLEFGARRRPRVAAAEARVRIAETRLRAAEQAVSFETARAFATVLAAQRRASLVDSTSRAFAEAERVTAERVRAGDAAGYDARRLQLEAARYATERASVLLALRAARVTLASLLDVRADAFVLAPFASPATTENIESLASVDSLIDLASASRPDLLVMQEQEAAARAESRLAIAERTPVPLLSAGYKQESNRQSPFGQPVALHGFVAGISLPLPLFDRRRGAIEAAAADVRVREAETDTVRRRIRAEVEESRAAYEGIAAQIALLRPQLGDNMRAALRAVNAAYVEGEIPLSAWLDAVRAWHEAESTFAVLEAELIIRRAALERAVGIPLFPSVSR